MLTGRRGGGINFLALDKSKTILGPKEFLGTLGNRVKFGAYGGEGWGDQFLSLR